MAKHSIQHAIALFAAIVLAALASPPAHALCPSPGRFSSLTNTASYTYIYTNGGPITPNLRGAFWAIGAGDPALLAGHDNGSWPALDAYGWIQPNAPRAYIEGGWGQDPRIDGCIELAPAPRCMGMILADTIGEQTFFAALSEHPTAIGAWDFSQPGNGPITLRTLPRPAVAGANRLSSTEVDITVASPAIPAGALYLDSGCAGIITGFRLYSRSTSRVGPPPVGRNVGGWTAEGGVRPLGSNATVSATCAGDENVYLAQTLVFDSGFELPYVSGNATPVQCGPNLAQPRPIRPLNRPVASRPRASRH